MMSRDTFGLVFLLVGGFVLYALFFIAARAFLGPSATSKDAHLWAFGLTAGFFLLLFASVRLLRFFAAKENKAVAAEQRTNSTDA